MSLVVPDLVSPPPAFAQVRPMTTQDAADLADTYWRSYRDQSPGFSLSHATGDIARIFSGDHGELVDDASLIAVVDGRGAGAVVTVTDPPYPATPAGAYVMDLYVVPAERRRGIGSALVRNALAALAGRTVHLRVDDDNETARRLYAAHGFAPVAYVLPDPSK